MKTIFLAVAALSAAAAPITAELRCRGSYDGETRLIISGAISGYVASDPGCALAMTDGLMRLISNSWGVYVGSGNIGEHIQFGTLGVGSVSSIGALFNIAPDGAVQAAFTASRLTQMYPRFQSEQVLNLIAYGTYTTSQDSIYRYARFDLDTDPTPVPITRNPEPSAWALMALGVGAIAVRRRYCNVTTI